MEARGKAPMADQGTRRSSYGIEISGEIAIMDFVRPGLAPEVTVPLRRPTRPCSPQHPWAGNVS